MSMSRESTGLK